MAGTRNNPRRVVTFYTNGQRAEDAYGLSAQVGRIVKRTNAAVVKARVSLVRKVQPMAKALLTARYTIAPSYLNDRVRVRSLQNGVAVDAGTFRFPLVLFRGKWGGRTSAGATASILQAQTKTYTGAFIAPGRFRGAVMPLIYTRKKGVKVLMKHGRYKGKMREQIVQNRGPSTNDMILGIERGGVGEPRKPDQEIVGDFAVGDVAGTLRANMAGFYISELRRLMAVEAHSG